MLVRLQFGHIYRYVLEMCTLLSSLLLSRNYPNYSLTSMQAFVSFPNYVIQSMPVPALCQLTIEGYFVVKF